MNFFHNAEIYIIYCSHLTMLNLNKKSLIELALSFRHPDPARLRSATYSKLFWETTHKLWRVYCTVQTDSKCINYSTSSQALLLMLEYYWLLWMLSWKEEYSEYPNTGPFKYWKHLKTGQKCLVFKKVWMPFGIYHLKTGHFVPYSNGIHKPNHLASNLPLTILIPDTAGIQIPTV